MHPALDHVLPIGHTKAPSCCWKTWSRGGWAEKRKVGYQSMTKYESYFVMLDSAVFPRSLGMFDRPTNQATKRISLGRD